MFSGLLVGSTLLLVCLPSFADAHTANSEQNVTLARSLQIPETVLEPGSYTFSIEDTMQDRAVVRIDTADKNMHYLVLTVPNGKLAGSVQDGLILFNTRDDKTQVLKGWMCPGCATALEFVYPKLEAVKITADSGESVLAVDPEPEKLPSTLSADDMKVVTLWLLSPKRISADDQEKTSEPQTAALVQSRDLPEVAGRSRVHNRDESDRRLPKTASDTFSLGLWGLLAIVIALGLRLKRARTSSRS